MARLACAGRLGYGAGVLTTVLIFCSIPWGSGEVGGKWLCSPSSKGRASRRVAWNPRPWVPGWRRVAALSFQMRGVPKGQDYCLQGACAGGSRWAGGEWKPIPCSLSSPAVTVPGPAELCSRSLQPPGAQPPWVPTTRAAPPQGLTLIRG